MTVHYTHLYTDYTLHTETLTALSTSPHCTVHYTWDGKGERINVEISTWGSHLLGEQEARLSVPIRGRPLETVWFSVLLLRTVGRPPVLTWRDLVLLTDACFAGSERWDDTRNDDDDDTRNESEPDLLGTRLRLDLILSNISILDLENSTGQVSWSQVKETNQTQNI